jgi:hypothetical protein
MNLGHLLMVLKTNHLREAQWTYGYRLLKKHGSNPAVHTKIAGIYMDSCPKTVALAGENL